MAAAKSQTLTLIIDDPQTVALLQQYKEFLQHEGIDGSLQEVAAGLIVGSMDENHAFTRWTKTNRAQGAAGQTPPLASNVAAFPARSANGEPGEGGIRKRRAAAG